MEIERKYLVTAPPSDYHTWEAVQMEQAYLCTEPVVRVRRENDSYVLTYKSKGLLAREEYNLRSQRKPMSICSQRPMASSSQRHAIKSRSAEPNL